MSLLDHALSVVIAAVLSATSAVAAESRPSVTAPDAGPLVVGRDVSWPNCPKGMGIPSRPSQGKPMPPPSARFVVVGLTNGPAFHPNPCLDTQVEFARLNDLWTAAYAVVTYPTRAQRRTYADQGPHDPRERLGRLRNTGAAQAEQNVAAMREVGLDSPIVWVDVEPVSPPAPWSRSRTANRAVLAGAVAAYRRAGLRVGFYSTPTHVARHRGTGALPVPGVAHRRPVDPPSGAREVPAGQPSRADRPCSRSGTPPARTSTCSVPGDRPTRC